jgi:Fe-S cluster assembly protein SufD
MSIQVSSSSIPNLSSAVLDSDLYLTRLLNLVVARSHTTSLQDTWLQELRDRAVLVVRQSALPTNRDEEWRSIDLSSLRQVEFNAETLDATSLQQVDIASITLPEAVHSRLVFVNGVYAPELSAVAGLPDGVIVSNLAGLSVEMSYATSLHSRMREYLAHASGADEVFTSLNTAGMTDVAVVWVAKNVVVETPIHLLFISTASKTPTLSQPRCFIVAETGSSVTLVEEFKSHKANEGQQTSTTVEDVYFTNAVTEIWVEDNAQVNHIRLQQDGESAFHIGKSVISQRRNSRYTCYPITLGGKLSRHNLEIFQTGDQTETILNGLTIIGGNQLADTHSTIALNHPYSTSRQLHKCIIGDRAHSVFNGKIFVPKAAQLTDAAQLNRNLLLSSKARVDTKPQLEITADNVKCAHGATVSQLEDDEIFYLQSRGIDEDDARYLLINAFAAEIINQIPVPSLREKLTQLVGK